MSASAAESLYRREHPKLWRSLVAYVGDNESASDAAAEAFAQLIARGSEVRDPRAWLWKTGFSIAGRLQAERKSKSPLNGRSSEYYDTPMVDLLDLLSNLTTQQRACVILRYVGNMKATEIADVIDTSPEVVRVQMHRAHTMLRSCLDEHERR